MKPVELKKGIYWVGGIDWDLREFHGYVTQRGSTYNAYLIIDEKITLIDTVKYYLFDEMLNRIKAIVDPSKIDYIISNHVEMDHSGSLPMIMEYCPNAKVFTSPNGEKGLRAHYRKDWDMQVVQTGDKISLGKRTIQFLLAPMVHWPDNMLSYCVEEKILFSNDAFGQHIASTQRFDDEFPINIAIEEAKKYYANIVMPYGKQVQKVLEAAAPLDIEIIATSHGLMWRSHIPEIIEQYVHWSKNDANDKLALIIYDTMWKSTAKMAYAIQDAFESQGITTIMYNLQKNHISDIMSMALTAKYICVGSPTLNSSILPTVAAFLAYMVGLAPKGRVGLAFGSYGWSGQSVDIVQESLSKCGFELMDQIKYKYIPSEDELKEITQKVQDNIKRIKEEK
ncbi:MAG TPA: FprA family A-type flavoprotein [Candidatus Cloacimonadota bacterium]|nr:FprA family A-type flavoprotein [Candidatus Cloacimonadota bacterium]HPT71386.1 FprA family A-type flavoprotein [Candidatus Cloacimonadota bacterium]